MGDKTRIWSHWRACFRFCRICVWLLILALICTVLWLNQIGLPNFAKRPLIDALRQQGIVLEFVRLRLNFVRGLVADNVRIGGESPGSPSLTLEELQLKVNYRALLRRKWQLDGVAIRQGQLVLPVSGSNDPPHSLVLDHIQTQLRFETNDLWALDNFQARFAGANFFLSGWVADAGAVSKWGIFQGKRGRRGASQPQLNQIEAALSQIHFSKNSQVSLNVHGDAKNINSFFLLLTVNAQQVGTPWGSVASVEVVAHSTRPPPHTGAAAASPLEIRWKAQLRRVKTDMANADDIYCSGAWHAGGKIEWRSEISGFQSKRLNADDISCDGFWRAPEVEITNLYARLGGGWLRDAARFNFMTRELYFTNSSCFNLHAIAGLLTEKTRERLEQFSLQRPPEFQAAGILILPNWPHGFSRYWPNVQPTIRLAGQLAVTNARVSGLSLDTVHARFSYSNETWTVPEAFVNRGASHLQIKGNENDRNREYQWRVSGAISSDVIEPFLTSKARREFGHLKFRRPLLLDARIHGRLYDYDSIVADGHASLADLSLHGEPIDSFESDFHYTRGVIKLLHPHLEAGAQTMRADEVRVDWPGDRVYFVNGHSIANPQAVANAIGRIERRVMEPYHFTGLADVIVNGYAPLRDGTNADLDFKTVKPAQLQILDIRSRAVSGEIHWVGKTLLLTNLKASLYNGSGTGNVSFDFRPRIGANFSFVSDFQNVDLQSLGADLSTASNQMKHLEGRVGGHFVVTSGYSEDWRSCNGYGQMELHDGLLWDVPVFGVLSRVFNIISPGLGNSRATDASAQFFMTNGVIATDNLQIHTKLMLLRCNGTLDLKGRLDAHFIAELLRDMPGVGPLFALVTLPVGKLCECKVTGTWSNPKVRALYMNVPQKLLEGVLHPFHSLENLENDLNRKNTQQRQPP